MSEQTFEMLWDCKFCGQRKNLGLTHRFCGSCGAPQDATSRYFPPEGEAVAVQQHVFVGADVQCAGCTNWNSRVAKCCTHCGAPVGGRQAPISPEPMQGHGFGHGPGGAQGQLGPGVHQGPGPTGAPNPKKKSPVLAIVLSIVGLLIFGMVGLFCTAMFWTREGAVEVSGHGWERTIQIEKLATVRASAWCDSLPAGARVASRRDEVRSTERIPDGETCSTRKKDQGDGTFKQVRECTPKYKEKDVRAPRCDYDIDQWQASRTATARGSSLREPPSWPATNVKGGTCLGCEREGARSEKYVASFVDRKTKKPLSCDLPVDRWSQLGLGSKWEGEIGVLTGALDCNALKPAR